LQLVDVLPGKDDVAFLDDEQRAPDAPLVAVDDDLTHVLVVPHVDLVTQETGPATLADLGHEVLRVLVEPNEVSVHVDPRELGLLALHLLCPEVREEELDLLFWETLRDVNHQCEILDQSAILAFWRLVRTEAAPLGRMEVAGFEVGLGARERGRDASEMTARGTRPRKLAFLIRSSRVSPRCGRRDRSRIDSTFLIRYSFACPVANFFSR